MRTSFSTIEKRLKDAEKHNRKPLLSKAIKEVQEIVKKFQDEYNSPEAQAKRDADYQELCRVGELRKGAYSRGEPMDKYPVPWETQEGIKKRIEEHEKDKDLVSCGWWTLEEWEKKRDELHQELQRRIELDEFYAKEGETRNEPRNKEF